MHDEKLLEQLAEELLHAEDTREALPKISERYPALGYDEAFSIHRRVVQRKCARGERVIGKKIGLTSKAMQQQAGVFEPDLGYMTDRGLVENGGTVDAAALFVPLVESEIAFVLGEDLPGPVVTVADVIRATAGVIPALEIVDTRYGLWQFKITDTVADSASYARVVLGGCLVPLQGLDLATLGMATYKNGGLLCTGAGAAVMGSPLHAVAWLANKLLGYGQMLQKGEIILSGALAGGYPVQAGDSIEASFSQLGSVRLAVV